MVFKFLSDLKQEVGVIDFETILIMAEMDIKFNRVGFGKTTGPKEFIKICTGCKDALMRRV